MKKNLLALVALSAMYSASAQDTYIKDAVVVKVNPNTLFYNGGNVNVKTDATAGTTEKIINEGNIQIQGGFTNQNTIGKNFVNKYIDSDSYGQLIIKNTTPIVTGSVSVEKSKIDIVNNQYFPIGLPFQKDLVKNIFNNITSSNSFKGDCALDVSCGNNRYNQTILLWDILQSEYDAVTNSDDVIPGGSYTVNVQNGDFRAFLNGLGSATKFSIFGIPNNTDFTKTNLESGIRNTNKATFSEYKWIEWKNLINSYNEKYDSYLGPGTGMDNNSRYAKNLHRFSNPYTSNLDLSDISKQNTWIKIVIGGVEKTPTELYDTTLRFKVTKLPLNYNVNWNGQTGTSNTGVRISAYLNKDSNPTTPYFWTGNPDALIVKPFEYFEVDYYTLVKANIGNTNIVTSNFKIGDSQKTFDYDFTMRNPNNGGVFAKNSIDNSSNLLNDEKLISKGLIAGNTFTQVEFFLTENSTIKGEAAYLVNGDFYTTGNATTAKISENSIFLYEEDKDGNVIEDSQTLLNQFNSQDYIGKPLRLGFNSLTEGVQYSINLRLFEQSILNRVNDLSLGKYYLLDKVTNTIVDVDETTQIKFTTDENINNRFEFYWNQKPALLGTDDINSNKTTYLFTKNLNKYVRFENNNTTATIEIYDVSGRLISRNLNVKTNADYKLNLANVPNLYVVKITYKDGKIISEKTTNR